MQEEQAAAAPAAGATVNDSAPQNAEADEGQPIELPEGAEDDLVEQIESAIVSTKEALDMFSEYYDDDCTKARGMFINNTSIQTGLNFANAVLDPEHVHQPVTPLHATTLGSSSESFDINSLL